MEFSLTVHYNLAQFLALFYYPCGVFLVHLDHGGHQLFSVLSVHGLDGA